MSRNRARIKIRTLDEFERWRRLADQRSSTVQARERSHSKPRDDPGVQPLEPSSETAGECFTILSENGVLKHDTLHLLNLDIIGEPTLGPICTHDKIRGWYGG
jgi:hypothetical protein